MLLDDAIRVGVLRGAPATHHKYAGRRILGSGHQPHAPLPGQDLAASSSCSSASSARSRRCTAATISRRSTADVLERRREKPWIAAVDSFAIGGDVPVAARHGLRDRRDGLVLRAPGAQGGDHPRLRQPAPAAVRRASASPARRSSSTARSRRTAPEGLHARRRGRAGGRDGRRRSGTAAAEVVSAGDDEPRRQPPWRCARRRSRSTSSGAT